MDRGVLLAGSDPLFVFDFQVASNLRQVRVRVQCPRQHTGTQDGCTRAVPLPTVPEHSPHDSRQGTIPSPCGNALRLWATALCGTHSVLPGDLDMHRPILSFPSPMRRAPRDGIIRSWPQDARACPNKRSNPIHASVRDGFLPSQCTAAGVAAILMTRWHTGVVALYRAARPAAAAPIRPPPRPPPCRNQSRTSRTWSWRSTHDTMNTRTTRHDSR